MQKIRATFRGTSPSLGYEPGKEYVLIIRTRKMFITREDHSGYCPYESLNAFFANWTNITHVKDGSTGK